MNNLAENQYGTGAIKNKTDLRDRKWHKLAAAVTPFDWSLGYDVEVELQTLLKDPHFKIPIKDQNGSSSCVGQASSYLESVQDAFEKGVYTEKSARDAYSQIFFPGGGSSTRSAVDLIIKAGICKEILFPSYQGGLPPTENFMERRNDASAVTVSDAYNSRGTAYAKVSNNIDSMAQAIRDNHGLIFVVEGKNGQVPSWRSETPQAPNTESEWAHCLYAGKAISITPTEYQGWKDGIINYQDLKQKYGWKN